MFDADTVNSCNEADACGEAPGDADLLILSDCTLFRKGLATALSGSSFNSIETAASVDVEELDGGSWDIVLLDVRIGSDIGDTLGSVGYFAGTPCVVVTDRFSFDVYAATLKAKACGYLLADIPVSALEVALQLVLGGKKVFPTKFALSYLQTMRYGANVLLSIGDSVRATHRRLSNQEVKILDYLVHGDANKVIARQLGNTEATVKVQMKALFRKLGLQNRTQAAVWAVVNGFGAVNMPEMDRGSLRRAGPSTGPGRASVPSEDSWLPGGHSLQVG